ncbi:MAG TPA: UDP-N-acetylmuramoyl-tripeptide--D-alanyl-D-alanine ligase [Rhodospirillales bacterium]|nr:UDP-N-acetylmuramoyl-tripeptide--D-alanyl-D-alanine ligase [Rhodospirillales bacterium]
MSAPVLWTAKEAALATGGRVASLWDASGVSIDSRSVKPGDLFIALSGSAFDGHDFVAGAFERGAVAAVVAQVPEGLGEERFLVVSDTLVALGGLGRAARERTKARIAAVTGSVGKTGTKEALRFVLSAQGTVCANEGNLNNQFGLPLSLARMPSDVDFGVFEMGMNHSGELIPLSRMARPHVALITTVEAVHSAHFSTVEDIALAKAEVFLGLETGGTAVLNRDNPHFRFLVEKARACDAKTTIGFGVHGGSDFVLTGLAPDDGGSRVEARIYGKDITYRIGAPGRHWALNSLGVLACVSALGADVKAAACALEGLRPPEGRGRRREVHLQEGDFTLIDESYNASPISMNAAFEVLAASRPGAGGRRIAVLGDMLELGEETRMRHEALAEPLESLGIDLVFTCGEEMARLARALPRSMQGGHALDAAGLAPLVSAAVRAGDVVCVKGSAGSRTGQIVQSLVALDTPSGGQRTPMKTVNGN